MVADESDPAADDESVVDDESAVDDESDSGVDDGSVVDGESAVEAESVVDDESGPVVDDESVPALADGGTVASCAVDREDVSGQVSKTTRIAIDVLIVHLARPAHRSRRCPSRARAGW